MTLRDKRRSTEAWPGRLQAAIREPEPDEVLSLVLRLLELPTVDQP